MSYTSLPTVTAGDFIRASWAALVDGNFDDHESRIVTLEGSGAGDVVGPSASIDSELALFDSTTGKLLKRATTTGLLKGASGVLSAATAGTDYVSPSSAETLTNKTLDAEGTGNLITIPFTVFWPAAVCDTGVPYQPLFNSISGATAPAINTAIGTNTTTSTLDFVDATMNQIWQTFRLPDDWVGAIDLKIFWKTASTTGNVVWQVQTQFVGDGGDFDAALNAAQTVTDAAQGVANRFNTATLSGLTLTNAAAGKWMWLRIFRDPAHVSDTIGGTASMLGVEMKYRRAM
jgi:hypothetical protein